MADFLREVIYIPSKKIKKNHIYFGLLLFTNFQGRTLMESDEWFIDGCFGNLPKFCKQVVQINCIHPMTKITIPSAWIIINSKKEILYSRMFEALKFSLNTLFHYDFQNIKKRIMSDMEISLQQSIEKSFPKSILKSCFFHYVKNLWEHSKKLGLKKKNNYKWLSIFISNFKIAVHIKDKNLQTYLVNQVEKQFIERNHFSLDEICLVKLGEFFTYIKKTYFDQNSFFSRYIDCR